jgi:competence protein ComEC
MVALALSLLAGILLVQQMATLPEIAWLPVAVLILGILVRLRWRKALFFLIGMLWAIVFATFQLNGRLPEELAGRDIQVKGYIAGLPEHESNNVRFNFNMLESTKQIPNKLRLTWHYPDQLIKAGQAWSFTVRLKPPHSTFNPGGFDYERWLLIEGIGATGYVRTKPDPTLLNNGSAKHGLLLLRQNIAEQLDQLLANSESLALIKALTIGDGDSLTPKQWEILRQTGTTHLMVISGSHIGLVAGLVYFLVIRLWAWSGILASSPQKVAAVVALVAAVGYAGLTGLSVPAQRAALMISVAMIAIIQQRNTQPYYVLAIALFAVLIVDPLVVLSAGFWLSFIAVSLIIYVIAGRLGKPGFFRGGIKINWVTSVGLAPLLLLFFQQVSLIAPLANLIAVPIISLLVVPLALLATMVMFMMPLFAAKLFWVVDLALQGLWWVLTNLAALPLSTITHTQPAWWALGFALPGILLLFAPKGMPSRWVGLIMLFPLVLTASEQVKNSAFKMSLLDVGQGLSAIVQTSNHVLVYDTGAKFSSTSDMGQSVVTPFLRSQGIDNIDTLIISHGDNDHIGGAESLLASFRADKVLTSVPQQLASFSPIPCKAGQTWEWDKVRFSIISPQPDHFASENDNSCVLQIQSQQTSVLLTGDIEAGAESWLTETYKDKLKADVLVAPHHGSQTSSTPAFLSAVNPSVIIIPAGYRNQFGHPHQEVIQRYQDLHINWLNSSEEGAIQIDTGDKLKVESWRLTEGRYWNYKND